MDNVDIVIITMLIVHLVTIVSAIVIDIIIPWYKSLSFHFIYLDDDLGWGRKLRQHKVTGNLQVQMEDFGYVNSISPSFIRGILDNGVRKTYFRTRGKEFHLEQEFEDPFNPTEEEITLFELNYGIDYNIALRRLTYMRKKHGW